MIESNILDIISKTEDFIKGYISRYNISYNFIYIERVLRNTNIIIKNETSISYNLDIIILVVLLYNIRDSKYIYPSKNNPTLIKNFLVSIKVPLELA